MRKQVFACYYEVLCAITSVILCHSVQVEELFCDAELL